MTDDVRRPPRLADTFCVLPWMHLEVMPQGTCKICCVAQEGIHERHVQMNVSRHSIAEIRGSPYMRSVREALASGRRIPACEYCWAEEQRGEHSRRQVWNERFAETLERLAAEGEAGRFGAEPPPLEYLQLSLGNKCNLACRMCNAAYSSRIAEDPVHAVWAPPGEIGPEPLPGQGREGWAEGSPWFEQPRFLHDEVLGNTGALKLLTVTGGEPLLSDAFQNLLDEYVRRGQAPNVVVRVSSNLFHNEGRIQRLLETLLRFRHCSVGASVDGYGAVYEYIRHPARWAVVARNLALVRDQARRCTNLSLTLDVVVQAYNCLNLAELLRHADSLGIECFLHVIDQPRFLQMHVVPRELRLRAAELLRAYAMADDPARLPTNRDYALRIAHHLELIADETDAGLARQQFAAFTQDLDTSRKQRLEGVVPELASLLSAQFRAARSARPR